MSFLEDIENDAFEESKMDNLGKEQLEQLAKMAQQQIELEQLIEDEEKNITELKKKLYIMTSTTIPEFMKEIGITAFTMDTGETLEVTSVTKASIANKNREAAFKWLRDAGHGDLIKNQMVVKFDRGEDKVAMELAAMAGQLGLSPEVSESVHPMTLQAFVKEQMQKGAVIPRDLLGVFEYDLTKIKKPKKRSK